MEERKTRRKERKNNAHIWYWDECEPVSQILNTVDQVEV